MTTLTYKTTDQRNSNGLFDRALLQDHQPVCTAEVLIDKEGNVVVIQLDTPTQYRGKGYARQLLARIGTEDTDQELRVVSTQTALGYYHKLGFTEIAPHVFSTRYQ